MWRDINYQQNHGVNNLITRKLEIIKQTYIYSIHMVIKFERLHNNNS